MQWNITQPLLVKKGILPFVTTWGDQEDTVLSNISQIQKDKYHLNQNFKMVKLTEAEARKVVTRG